MVWGQEVCLSSKASRQAMGPTQLSVERTLYRGYGGWDVKLTSHIYPVLRLRMCGVVPNSPHVPPLHRA